MKGVRPSKPKMFTSKSFTNRVLMGSPDTNKPTKPPKPKKIKPPSFK